MTPATDIPTGSKLWQSIVDTLERAAVACDGYGNRSGVLEDRILWRHHSLTIRNASDALCLALRFNPEDTFQGTAAGSSALLSRGADAVPLLEQAWRGLELLQDDPDLQSNVPLLLASFEVADVLAAIRGHDE